MLRVHRSHSPVLLPAQAPSQPNTSGSVGKSIFEQKDYALDPDFTSSPLLFMHSPDNLVSFADSIAICERRDNLHILSAISCLGGLSLDSSYCCGSDSLHLQCSKKRSQLQVSCHRLWWFSSLFRCFNTVLACIDSFLHVLYFAQSMLCEASVYHRHLCISAAAEFYFQQLMIVKPSQRCSPLHASHA